jgi:hypothetical protein
LGLSEVGLIALRGLGLIAAIFVFSICDWPGGGGWKAHTGAQLNGSAAKRGSTRTLGSSG